jgi:hypothetical protein
LFTITQKRRSRGSVLRTLRSRPSCVPRRSDQVLDADGGEDEKGGAEEHPFVDSEMEVIARPESPKDGKREEKRSSGQREAEEREADVDDHARDVVGERDALEGGAESPFVEVTHLEEGDERGPSSAVETSHHPAEKSKREPPGQPDAGETLWPECDRVKHVGENEDAQKEREALGVAVGEDEGAHDEAGETSGNEPAEFRPADLTEIVRPEDKRSQEIEEKDDRDDLLDREEKTQERHGNESRAEADHGSDVERGKDDDRGVEEEPGMAPKTVDGKRGRHGEVPWGTQEIGIGRERNDRK